MRRVRRTIVPLAVLAAAVALVLVGQAVFAVAGDLRSPDLKREPSRSLPSRVASGLVADDSTITFRQALRLLKQTGGPKAAAVKRRAEAEAKLDRLTRHGSRAARSRAENLLTILRLHDSFGPGVNPTVGIDAAIQSFGQAARLDPRNADAKYNLELLLTLRPKGKSPQKPPTRLLPQKGKPTTGHAGSVRTGAGY